MSVVDWSVVVVVESAELVLVVEGADLMTETLALPRPAYPKVSHFPFGPFLNLLLKLVFIYMSVDLWE